MNKPTFNLEKSLGYLIGRAGRLTANRLNQNFEKAGQNVTCEQWAVLMNLWCKNGQCQKELTEVSYKDKASIARLIDGLERRNLVVRIPDKQDGRQKLIYLTSKGKELQQELLGLVQKTLLEAQEGIKESDLTACKKVLSQVFRNLS